MSGLLSGEFHLTGAYERPLGFGAMTIDEASPTASRSSRRPRRCGSTAPASASTASTSTRAAGTLTGAAFVGWDSTYSFNADGRRIPVERLALLRFRSAPLSGLAEFTADRQRHVRRRRATTSSIRVDDLFVGEEGVGQVTGTLALRGNELSGELDAASPRLALTGTGRIALTPQADAELTFRFHDSSLDPYVRLFVPQLSPFTTAVASGSIRIVGELADLDHLLVDGTVDTLDMRLFDYALKNAAPIRISLDQQQVQRRRTCSWSATTRGCAWRARRPAAIDRIALQASGDANLGILQGFFRDVRGVGPRRADGGDRRPARAAACSPAAPRSPTAASATSRCRTRSTPSTA